MLGNLIGPISSGYIASVTSINFVFVLSGALLVAGAFIAYKTLKEAPKAKQKVSDKDKSIIKEEIAEAMYD